MPLATGRYPPIAVIRIAAIVRYKALFHIRPVHGGRFVMRRPTATTKPSNQT